MSLMALKGSLYDMWAIDVSILMLAIFSQEKMQQQLNI